MKSNKLFIIVFVYILFVVCLYFLNCNYSYMGDSITWVQFSNYLAGMSAPVTALGTIYITYLVYKLNDDSHKSERYFERIVYHFLKIQKLHKELDQFVMNKRSEEIEEYDIKIKTQVQLLRYYLCRFPDKSHSVRNFDLALNDIFFDTKCLHYYQKASSEFDTFCFYAYQDQKRPINIEKTKNGGVDINY